MESLLILVPLFCIIILNLPLKDLMRKIAFFVAALLFLIQIAMVVFHPTALLSTITNALSPYFVLNFSVDRLSLVMLLTIGLVELVALIVGNYLISDYRLRFKFINLLVVACIGMNAMVMVRDLFSLYVFLEITAVSAFILIAIQKGKLALESAFKYLLLSAIASVLMLTAISIILLVSGDLTFLSIAKGLALNGNSFYIKLSIALFLCGLLIKSGVVPFHGWLPDVYQASPTYTSILVAGVLTKISGVYVLIRLVSTVFGNDIQIQTILMFAGALSIVVGALAALGQKDFKRMLAYSSISQVGYIILALGAGSNLAFAGAVASSIIHDFRNPMSAMRLDAQLLQQETIRGADARPERIGPLPGSSREGNGNYALHHSPHRPGGQERHRGRL